MSPSTAKRSTVRVLTSVSCAAVSSHHGHVHVIPTERRSWFRRLAKLALFLFVVGVGLHLASPPRYAFPPAVPFSGEQWYDPYDAGGVLLRANFHAHSRAWGGLTNGADPPEAMRAAYRELGYDVYPLSNYQQILPGGPNDGVPVTSYEHGFGLIGNHHTVIGAAEVEWLEYSLPHTLHHKQQVLDTLATTAPIVIINHPSRKDSFPVSDFDKLVGYNGIEVLTKRSRSREHWDTALSAGRPVWGYCADDGHDLSSNSDVGIGWNMIHAADRSPAAVIEALRAGHFHGVWSRHKEEPNVLRAIGLDDGTLSLHVERPADEIRFIGQGGRVLHAAQDTDRASYAVQPDDTYVRAEAETGDTTLVFNPVFRHDGDPFAQDAATVRPLATWVVRIGALLAVAFVGWWMYLRRRA